MEKDLVSIIIPAYNAERFIRRCIISMLNQTYPNIEIIVVYDKSQDNTYRILQEFKNSIKIIKQNKKTNPAIAMNRGIKRAKGEYIAFCGADDFFAQEKIEKQVRFFEKNPDVGVVYTDAIIIDEKENIIKYYQCPEWNKNKWLFNHYIIGSSVLIKRETLDRVGVYYDESLDTCEDLDLFIRLSNITKFKRLPEFLTYYTIHSRNLSKNQTLKFDIDRIKVFYKHKLLLPLLHSIFILFRNQIIDKTPIINKAYERVSKKFKKHHFWEG
ncbi:MAG: hypothetical protein PWP22_1151 [Thermoanaerobacter sp.]|nr:hypothetical protein [Thermoanaerobacter sp.]